MDNRSIKKNTDGRRASVYELVTAVLFCAFIGIFGILSLVLPQRAFSEEENRSLTTLDELFSANVARRLVDGDFTEDAGDFCRDQFPLRYAMLRIKAATDMLLVRRETNGVLYGSGGYLISHAANAEYNGYLEKNLAALDALCAALDRAEINCVFAAAPRSADVLRRYYPSGYNGGELVAVRNTVYRTAFDLYTPLAAAADSGEYVYYRTDHHWTTEGAYRAYLLLSEALGITPLARDEITVERASAEFCGTTYSKPLSPGTVYDVMEYYRYDGDNEYTTEIIDTGDSFQGFYNRTYLTVKDKYSSFIGGNHAHVRITKNGAADRPVLIVVKDSFAHSLIPFLCRDYDLEIIDPRYYQGSVYELALSAEAEGVLVLCGIDTLTDAPTMLMLNFGLPSAE